MKNFNLKKLWDLRGELDRIILSGKYEEISKIREKYENMVGSHALVNRSFICFNHAFWSDYEMRCHYVENVNSIRKNINNFERKFVKGEDVSLKLKNFYCSPFLAGEIWVLRAMYDKFVFDAQNVQMNYADIQQNMLLGQAVKNRLSILATMDQTEYCHDTIKSDLLTEVKACYENIYGKGKPRVTYEQISEDFMEMH